MPPKIQHKRSAVAGKAPQPADLDYGEIAVNYEATDPALYVKDSADNIVKLAGSGSVGDDWTRTGTDLSPKTNGDSLQLKDGTGAVSVDLDAGASASPLVRDSSGRLGVGTATPQSLLSVQVSSARQLNVIKDAVDDNLVLTSSSPDASYSLRPIKLAGDKVAFSTGASTGTSYTERMVITDTGAVGIGITSPSQPLHVSGSARADAFLSQGYFVGQGNLSGADARSGLTGIGPSSATTPGAFYGGYSLFYGAAHTTRPGDVEFGTGQNTNGSIQFKIDQTERARIDSSGRLLVGTSTARANMFNSIATSTLQLEAVSSTTGAGRLSVVYNDNSADSTSIILGKSRATTVGGSTAVQSGDALGSFSWQGADGSELVEAARIIAEVDGTPGANNMPGRLTFSTTPSGSSQPVERVRIHENGAVNFGSGIAIGGSTSVNRGATVFIDNTVVASGAGNSTLKYTTSSGLVTFDTSSRLVKDDIQDCPYGAAEIKLLKPRKYFRTDDKREEIGFVADELVAVLPEFVPIGPKSVITKKKEDTEEVPIGVNYDKLTAVLTKALQEALTRIEQLEAKVTALEGGAPAPIKDSGTGTRNR